MDLGEHTILITGGASGIGLALAVRFLRAGSRVIVCGRREEKLREAAAAHPGLVTHAADVATPAGRRALCDWVTQAHPGLDVLVNNAGIQRRFQLTEPADWDEVRQELAINLEAPLHLSLLLLPHLARQPRPAIVNVTSGLSFAPLTAAPVYSATKAALHSLTLSLRHQLSGTPVSVVEVIRPRSTPTSVASGSILSARRSTTSPTPSSRGSARATWKSRTEARHTRAGHRVPSSTRSSPG